MCSSQIVGGAGIGCGSHPSVPSLLVADRGAVSWFPIVEAGVGLYELGFLVGGEGAEVDVHCVPTLGCGASSLVVSSTLLISELPSNLEVLFKGLPFGVISFGGVVKLRGLPLSMLFLGGLRPLLEIPGDCWVIIVAVDDGFNESLVESFFKDLQDAMLVDRNVGKVDKSLELQDVLVEAVCLFQLLKVNVCVTFDVSVSECLFEVLLEVDPKAVVCFGDGWYPCVCFVKQEVELVLFLSFGLVSFEVRQEGVASVEQDAHLGVIPVGCPKDFESE